MVTEANCQEEKSCQGNSSVSRPLMETKVEGRFLASSSNAGEVMLPDRNRLAT
jgi:hypothetical protein